MQRIDRFTRRSLLKSLGVGAGLLPMLEVEYAHAQVPPARCAFIFVWPNGMMSMSAATGWPAPSATAEGITFKAFQSSLEPLRSDLLLLDGVDYRFLRDSRAPENTGHACYPGMLTGALFKAPGTGTSSTVAGGISIDQYIGAALVKAGYPGLPSLNLGVVVKSTGRLSWRAAGDAVIPATDPYRVFADVFGGAAAPTPGMPTAPDPAIARNRTMKKSILDTVRKDLTRFNTRVGMEDRQRIEAHLSSIRALELELDRQGMTPVGGGSRPQLPAGVNTAISENFESTTKMMIDISVAAMAADATRVVVLQLGDQGNANVILSTLGYKPAGQVGNTGNFNGHHAIAHRNAADKDKLDTWFQSQIAYSITSMKSAGLLERGVFLAMNNMRHGMHEFNNVPAVMAGTAGGYFKTGRSLKLPSGTANNGILVALANALGVPTQTFGHAAYGGELTALRG